MSRLATANRTQRPMSNEQNEFTSSTIHVELISPKCKKTGHWYKYDVDISTYSGPLHKIHYAWYTLNWAWLYMGGDHLVGTKTAVHKTRVVMLESDTESEDVANDCPTNSSCHCTHTGCVCKSAS